MVSHISFLSLMRRVIMNVLFLLAFTIQLHSQPYLNFNRIGVNWPTISLYLSVKCGSDIRWDLSRNYFSVKENGEIINDFDVTCPDPSTHCCLSAALVIDRSGSTNWGNPSALDLEKAGANVFIDAMDGTCDEATLISFNEQVTVDVFMTWDKALLHNGVNALRASGSSAVWDGAITGINEVVNNGSQECRAVILFTDGNDDSSENSIDDVISLALQNKIRVFTIGYGDGINDTNLARIANDTGGK